MTITIKKITAREILDSRGYPTVEAEILASNHMRTYASVPSGASTGKNEALELRDHNQKRFLGKGVLQACAHISEKIAPMLEGTEILSDNHFIHDIDHLLIHLDGTPNKSHLGSNACLAVSLAMTKLCAEVFNTPLFEFLNPHEKKSLPVPMMNIINGGAHANNGLDIQEFMIIPAGLNSFSECLRAGVEIFQYLKEILRSKNLSTAVGDEGGFAPEINSHTQAIDLILEAITRSDYHVGQNIYLGLDVASSEFYKNGKYFCNGSLEGLTSEAMLDYLKSLVKNYPIISIEDGMSEEDWEGWKILTQDLGKHLQLVGDDLFVTDTVLLEKGIKEKIANAILIKPNQIGTVTETLAAIKLAKHHQYATIISHRSGETEETFIADLAVATHARQIKTGSLSRSDRVAKYNELLRIEQKLGPKAIFCGKEAFSFLENVKS